MNICENWFPIQIFTCFEQCISSPYNPYQTITLLRDELHETITELKDMMDRLERVTAELKESAIDVELYKYQIQSLTAENEKLKVRIKKLEGTFHSTDILEIKISRLKLREPI